MPLEWKDVSSFSRGDKDRTPNCWELKAGRFQLRVHRYIHYAPDMWLFTCDGIRFDKYELESKDVEDAKAQAVALFRCALEQALDALKEE